MHSVWNKSQTSGVINGDQSCEILGDDQILSKLDRVWVKTVVVTVVGPGWSSNNTALPLFVTLKLAISFGIHDTCFVTAMQGLIPFYEGERSHGGQHLNQDFSWSSLFRKVTGRNQSIKDQKVEVCPRREVWLEVEQAKKKKEKALLLTGCFWVWDFFFSFCLFIVP